MPAIESERERWTTKDYKNALQRLATSFKNYREKGSKELAELGERGLVQFAGVATGGIIGASRAFMGNPTTGDIEVMGVDVDMAVGVLLAVPAAMGWFGEASNVVNVIASQVNAITVARETERFLKKK